MANSHGTHIFLIFISMPSIKIPITLTLLLYLLEKDRLETELISQGHIAKNKTWGKMGSMYAHSFSNGVF